MSIIFGGFGGSENSVMPSEVEGWSGSGAATWTERPEAERAGGERIKYLDRFLSAGGHSKIRDVSTALDMTRWCV
jgi:hypothetical protein